MRLLVSHHTVHRYDGPLMHSAQLWRLTPREGYGQAIERWSVRDDDDQVPPHYMDAFGNLTHLWVQRTPCSRLRVRVEGIVATRESGGLLGSARETLPPDFFLRDTPLTASHPALADLAAAARGRDALDQLHRLLVLVHDRVRYQLGATDVATPAALAVLRGAGVCQDHAHVFVAAARILGHPARYVSGYLHADSPGSHRIASHAWAEAWHPDLGWIGFDASHGCCPDGRFIRVATALDYDGAAPIRGVQLGATGERLEVSVHVQEVCGQ
jgi:transglutaminase-like putative cysteine protease